MFFIFLHLASPSSEVSPDSNAPKFDRIMVGNPFQTILDDNFQINTNLSDTTFGKGSRSSNEYYFCALTIKNCAFENSMGFGRGLNVGYGGAIYVDQSQLLLMDSKFTVNSATTGGAIAMNGNDALFTSNNFSENHAYIKGGAIFMNSGKFLLYNQKFLRNKADSNAGAIFANNCTELYLENTLFQESTALIQGGAVEVISSSASFINCIFKQNSAGDYTQYVGYNGSNVPKLGMRFTGRACACISAIKCSSIITDGCEFLLNEMNYGFLKSIQLNSQGGGLGVNIMLQDCNFWQSTSDCFLNNNHYFIYGDTKATYQITGTTNKCMPQNIIKSANSEDNAIPKLLTIGVTDSVPDPTPYTYAATPITKLTSPLSDRKYSTLNLTYSTKTPNPTLADVPPNPTEEKVSKVTPGPTPDPTRTLNQKETFKVTTTNITTFSTIQTNITTIVYTYTTTTIRIYVNNTIIEISTVTESESTLSNTIILTNSSVFSETVVFTQSSTLQIIYTFLETYIQTETDVIIIVPGNEDVGKSKTSASEVILISTLSIGSAFILAGIGLFLYRKNKQALKEEDSETNSIDELTMQEEIGSAQMIEKIDEPIEGADEAGTSLDF